MGLLICVLKQWKEIKCSVTTLASCTSHVLVTYMYAPNAFDNSRHTACTLKARGQATFTHWLSIKIKYTLTKTSFQWNNEYFMTNSGINCTT